MQSTPINLYVHHDVESTPQNKTCSNAEIPWNSQICACAASAGESAAISGSKQSFANESEMTGFQLIDMKS